MKAERRHELKTNQLARSLETLPEKLSRHANKILFAVLVVLVLALLIRYRINSAENRRIAATQGLANVQAQLSELQFAPIDVGVRSRLKDVLDNLNDVDAAATDMPTVAAGALVARGDINLALAGQELASSTPLADMDQTPADLLQAAQDAFQQVIDKYPDQTLNVASAHFGLAAVAEDQHDWDAARRQYQAVIDLQGIDPSVKKYAQSRIDFLKTLSKPVYLGQPVAPATAPATTR